MKFKYVMTLVFVFSAGSAFAETAHNQVLEAKKDVKAGINNAKDKGCELVNGKMQCLGKKIKHKAENAGDAVKTAVDKDK